MNTRQKIMGLAALPLAGLLATGGAALAQTAGTPASTQVVQQAAVQKAGDPCPEHAAKTVTQQTCDQSQVRDRDRDRDGSCDQQVTTVQTAERTMEHARDGSCVLDADQ